MACLNALFSTNIKKIGFVFGASNKPNVYSPHICVKFLSVNIFYGEEFIYIRLKGKFRNTWA